MEKVLYYKPEKNEDTVKLTGVFIRMGIRMKNIEPEQFDETVGYLAGIKGFEAKKKSHADVLTENDIIIPEEVLVLQDFTRQRIDMLLREIKKTGRPKVDLKAVITPKNVSWTFYKLYEEIKREHEAMSKKD